MINMNVSKEIKIKKVTLNMGIGGDPTELKKGETILQKVTGQKTVRTKAKIRQPAWGLRLGLPIAVKTTLRKKKAEEFLVRALKAKDNTLKIKNFDKVGNFGFGIKEYIDVPGTKYDPSLGIRGFDVLVTLERNGYRIKRRKIQNNVGKTHVIKKEEAIEFMKSKFGIEVN